MRKNIRLKQVKYKCRLVLLICLLVFSNSVFSQFEGAFSQYMFNKTYFNPAAVGEENAIQVLGVQRLQWLEFTNGPIMTYFTANMPFTIGKTNHAGGVSFYNDKAGLFNNVQIQMKYAYRFKLGEGVLSAGLNLGITDVAFSGDSVRNVESEYHTGTDPILPTKRENGTAFDLGLGVYYSSKDFYAGIALAHLTSPNIELGELTEIKQIPYMSIMGGYNWNLRNPKYTLKPSVFVGSDFVGWQAKLSMLLDYDKKFYGGLTYSINDALTFHLGMNILNGLSIGYGYDLPVTELIKATHGSHELFIAYSFNIEPKKKAKKQKSVRYL